MEIFSTIISLMALGFTAYVYLAHDKKLNEQQKLLNEISLKKAREEEEAVKKAKIFLEHVKEGSADKLIISNIGQANAYDIKLSSDVENDPVMMLDLPPEWHSISPGHRARRPLPLGRGVAMNVEYEVSWRDDAGEHKERQSVDYY